MASTSAIPSFQSTDAACWKEAVQLYNAQQDGPSSNKYIHLNTAGPADGQAAVSKEHARQLMVAAIGSYQNLKKKRGPVAITLVRIYNNLRQYSRAVDVLVQCDPTIAALVWGSVRVLLQIGEEEERASQIAAEGILEIIRHAGRWEQVSTISDLLSSPRLRRALVTLYVTLLDFLQSSTRWLDRGSLERLGISILSSKREKFEAKLKAMRSASEVVDKELQTQGTYKGLDSLGKIAADVQVSMEKIDRVLGEVQHLADYTLQLHRDGELLALTDESASAVKTVLSELQALPASIAHTFLAQMNDTLGWTEIKRWLALSAVETSPPVPHVDGTCTWLERNPTFVEWSITDSSLALWVLGHQGSGKSVMAGYLQEHMTAERSGDKVLFYRFQRSAVSAQSTPISFASSLISQLLDQSAALHTSSQRQQLQTMATQFPLGPQQGAFKMLWAIAVSLLKSAGSRFVLIIDALDECSFDSSASPSSSSFLDTLSDAMRDTRSKLLIFSRPDPMFAAAVRSGLSIFLTHGLLLADIMALARREYAQLELPASETDAVLELIRSASQGSFRWTEMFLHHLGQSLKMEDFHARMQSPLPPLLSDLYRQSLLSGVQRLNPDELNCRNALLLAIFQAQRPLRTAEIADALSLRPGREDIIISNLCKPLASTHGGFFHLSHPSAREFFETCHREDDSSLGISFAQSHGLLAELCLACLSDAMYADLHRIGSALLQTYGEHGRKVDTEASSRPEERRFYDYAFRFWDFHLARATAPSRNLIRKANRFLLSLQFAYWSERTRQDTQLIRVNEAYMTLVTWCKGLPGGDGALIELDQFFEHAYTRLSAAFEASTSPDNKVLPWLTRMAVGDFYFIAGFTDKASLARPAILPGLRSVGVGPQHPLMLRAKSDMAYARIQTGRMRAAHRLYSEVASIQQEVVGEDSSLFLNTLSFKGQSEYFMADFVAAVLTWTKVSAGALGLLGPDSFPYIAAQMWYAQAMAYMGHLELGLHILQSLVQRRRELCGDGDGFVNVAQLHAAEIQLLLGRHDEAIAVMHKVLAWWRTVYPISNIYRLDPEITLAFAYHNAGRDEDASTLLWEIEEGAENLSSEFERHCQVAHLKGLLLAKAGCLDEAIHGLQDTVTQAHEDQNNRALLWVRLDLATLLRRRDGDGDRDQASANFDGIVRDTSGDWDPGFPDEPDPPRLLAAAERALRLVRARKHTEARRELTAEQLDWRRPSDFWLWLGGTFYLDMLRLVAEPYLASEE